MPCSHATECPVAAAAHTFRTRIEAEIAHGTAFLAAQRGSDGEKSEVAGARLGAFAGGRIDASRFDALLAAGRRTDAATLDRVAEALGVLREHAARLDDLVHATCPPGGALRHTAAEALGELGRVFGAARVVELARTERYRESEHGRYLLGLPFAQWSRAEREAAPWLHVTLRGADLHAAGLAEFLDGGVKLLLEPEGAVPPAALVRLATPNVYVAQVVTAAELAGFASFAGPAAAALVPEGAARFVHDPRRGAAAHERFAVAALPAAPRRGVGAWSPFQMNEDLLLLATLATPPAAPAPAAGGTAPAPAADPAERLAAWLLAQAGLSGAQSA